MPGGPEMVFILIIVVLLFGAKKLPELTRGLGRILGEFKKARDEFERELHSSASEVEVKTPLDKQAAAPEPAQGIVRAEDAKEATKPS